MTLYRAHALADTPNPEKGKDENDLDPKSARKLFTPKKLYELVLFFASDKLTFPIIFTPLTETLCRSSHLELTPWILCLRGLSSKICAHNDYTPHASSSQHTVYL